MGTMVYNVNNTATQVLAQKQAKENIFVNILHRNGKGVYDKYDELGASTVRFLKVKPSIDDARKLGATTNGGWFNSEAAKIAEVSEYDLNLLYIYDRLHDLPEVQQDMCPIDIFEQTTKNIGGAIATEINASTLATQLAEVYNAVKTATAWTGLAVELPATDPNYLEAVYAASSILDDGDWANGIQSFPFDERELILRPSFRQNLMTKHGVLIGGSNYAQSMIAKGALSPDDEKEFGNMFCGEIDMTPCYICPSLIWQRASKWVGQADGKAFDGVQAVMCAASATDRGISSLNYIKIIDSPNGVGKRMQPKTRWGINVAYPKGIVPIIANATAVPAADLEVQAPAGK